MVKYKHHIEIMIKPKYILANLCHSYQAKTKIKFVIFLTPLLTNSFRSLKV